MRILAIDPSTYGFGFAVFEGPRQLVDWGLVHVGSDKNAESLKRIEDLLHLYQPTGVVLEDCGDRRCRKQDRTRALIREVAEYAAFFDLEVVRVAWRTAGGIVGGVPRPTKAVVAAEVARRFPEVSDRLPPRRKPWMSEDARMSIFDAIALGIVAALDTSSGPKS